MQQTFESISFLSYRLGAAVQNRVRRVCSKATRAPLSFLSVLCGMVSSYSIFIGSSWLNLGFKSWHLGVEFLKAIAFLFTELKSSNPHSSPQDSVTFLFKPIDM